MPIKGVWKILQVFTINRKIIKQKIFFYSFYAISVIKTLIDLKIILNFVEKELFALQAALTD